MVRVSIVIPTYNRREHLSQALQSVREQTHTHFECLVVDDGSTDGTQNLLANCDDDWLRKLRQGDQPGLGNARNIGINEGQGEYIIFLDSDDLLYPHAVQRLTTVMDDQPNNCAGAFATKQIVTRHERTVRRDVPEGPMTTPSLTNARTIGGLSGTIFRRKTLIDIGGFDESLPARMDLELYIRLLKRYSLYGIDEVCCVRQLHGDQLSRDQTKIREGLEKLSKKHQETLKNSGEPDT